MLAGLVAFVADMLAFRMSAVEWSILAGVATTLATPLSVAAGLVGLHALQKDHHGRIGRGALWTIALAILTQVVGLVVYVLFATGGSPLDWTWIVISVGIAAVMIGVVLYGVATLQARVLPRWCGIAIMVAPFLFLYGFLSGRFWWPFFLGDYAAQMLFGLVWVALGYALWSRSRAATEQPSRVR